MRWALLILFFALPAFGGECVVYLKRAAGGFNARLYEPNSKRDVALPAKNLSGPDLVWDGRFHNVYWMNKDGVSKGAWLEGAKRKKPIPIPEEFSNRAAWWLSNGKLQVVIFADAGRALERWEHSAGEKTWHMIERERLNSEGESAARQGQRALFAWTGRRQDWSMTSRIEAMRGTAHLGPHIRWEGTRDSGQGFWSFFNQDRCGLKIQVQRDEKGAHVVAPLIHWCERPDPPKVKPGYPEPELEPVKGKILFNVPQDDSFTPIAFQESGKWLLVGREAEMTDATLYRLKDASIRRSFAPAESHAAWVPCPTSVASP